MKNFLGQAALIVFFVWFVLIVFCGIVALSFAVTMLMAEIVKAVI